MPRTRPLLAAALAVASLGPLASCDADLPLTDRDDAFCRRALGEPDGVEVFDWLKAPSGGPKCFGEWSTDQGLAFAHELERRGAGTMTVVGVRKQAGPEPSEHAGGLVIELPAEPPKRLSVFKLYAEQVRSEGYAPQADVGQNYLFIPWDK